MKLSLEWLGDYVTFAEDDPQAFDKTQAEKIADAITAHTAEVDAVEVQGELLDHCCVGKVLRIEKHPNADKLNLCEVLTDKGAKRVVCGGTNLRVGMRVAFAHIGATVKWHGESLQTLAPVKIRGEQSEGMICAAEELGIGQLFPECTGHTIVDMGNGDADVGRPLKEALGLSDVVLHIDNHAITHRADLFSHIGFAFECVAMGIAKWKKMPEFRAPEFPKEKLPFRFRVTGNNLIPRYCSCLIGFDALGETPAYMAKRLASLGIRSVNLPVDITNYVMCEVGVPMHCFDADDIKGDCVARIAKEGELLRTLDGKVWKLPAGALVFTDDEGNFDLVGIMGGFRSSMKDTTRRAYLHALSLDPVRIRSTVIATGHRTDAATIYEKKVPHIATELGFYRALELFLLHVPGANILSAPEVFGDNGTAKPIALSLSHAQSMLGVAISEAETKKILTDLAFEVSGKGDALTVKPPLHRLGDISGAHDLVEEIGRMYGYNAIEASMPSASIAPPARDTRTHILRDALARSAYTELLPLSLVGPDLLRTCGIDPASCVELQNPIGSETSLMAPSTLPALLQHAEKNMLLVEGALRTFHISSIFGGQREDHLELGALLAARTKTDIKTDPFLLLKEEVFEACSRLGYTLRVDVCPAPPPFAHAGRCADLRYGDATVGTLFDVHPHVLSHFDLPARAAAVILNLTELLALSPREAIYREVPSLPAITYDVTVPMDHGKNAGKLLAKIRESSTLLESAEIADLYGQDTGTYNLTLRCTYRAKDRTLTEEEAKKEFMKVESLIGV